MRHLLYLMFRCDVDVMESLELEGIFWELNTATIDMWRICLWMNVLIEQLKSINKKHSSYYFWKEHKGRTWDRKGNGDEQILDDQYVVVLQYLNLAIIWIWKKIH